MYEVKSYELEKDMFLAGYMDIAKEELEVAEGETIQERSLIKLSGNKAAAYTAEDAEAGKVPYGIAVGTEAAGYVVAYLSGEFYESGLKLPDGVGVETVKPLLRENGIFLKELLPDTAVKV
jgi:hypothetical protein